MSSFARQLELGGGRQRQLPLQMQIYFQGNADRVGT